MIVNPSIVPMMTVAVFGSTAWLNTKVSRRWLSQLSSDLGIPTRFAPLAVTPRCSSSCRIYISPHELVTINSFRMGTWSIPTKVDIVSHLGKACSSSPGRACVGIWIRFLVVTSAFSSCKVQTFIKPLLSTTITMFSPNHVPPVILPIPR